MADSIVDEVARAIGNVLNGDCSNSCEPCRMDRARAAAAVVARRLREHGHLAQTDDTCRVCKVVAELEGK